jgi:GT2 family glycosyltransferase
MMISIIVPIGKATSVLNDCIGALLTTKSSNAEIILVFDREVDNYFFVFPHRSVRIVFTGKQSGPAYTRNLGAKYANGEVLFFIDSDVIVHQGTFSAILHCLMDENCDVLTGVYSYDCGYTNYASIFKNIWMRTTYLMLKNPVPVVNSALMAIHREAFDKVGGFDNSYLTPSLEDSDLGRRLNSQGLRCCISKDFCAIHRKRYSIGALIKTDFSRSIAETRLLLRHGLFVSRLRLGSSVPVCYFISIPILVVSCFFTIISFWVPESLLYASFLLILFYFLNYWILRQFNRLSIRYFVSGLILLPIITLTAIAGCFVGGYQHVFKK